MFFPIIILLQDPIIIFRYEPKPKFSTFVRRENKSLFKKELYDLYSHLKNDIRLTKLLIEVAYLLRGGNCRFHNLIFLKVSEIWETKQLPPDLQVVYVITFSVKKIYWSVNC